MQGERHGEAGFAALRFLDNDRALGFYSRSPQAAAEGIAAFVKVKQ